MAMLRSVKSILGYRIEATDGGIGKIVDAYFNDAEWVIRYMVVDTGIMVVRAPGPVVARGLCGS
jgi:hypothetical protein